MTPPMVRLCVVCGSVAELPSLVARLCLCCEDARAGMTPRALQQRAQAALTAGDAAECARLLRLAQWARRSIA